MSPECYNTGDTRRRRDLVWQTTITVYRLPGYGKPEAELRMASQMHLTYTATIRDWSILSFVAASRSSHWDLATGQERTEPTGKVDFYRRDYLVSVQRKV